MVTSTPEGDYVANAGSQQHISYGIKALVEHKYIRLFTDQEIFCLKNFKI